MKYLTLNSSVVTAVPSPQAPPGVDKWLTYAGWLFYTCGLAVLTGLIIGIIVMIVGAFRRGAFEGGKLIVVSILAGMIISAAGVLVGQFLQGVPSVAMVQPPWLNAVNTLLGWILFVGGIAALVGVAAGAVWMISGALRHGIYEGAKAIGIALLGAALLGSLSTWAGSVIALG